MSVSGQDPSARSLSLSRLLWNVTCWVAGACLGWATSVRPAVTPIAQAGRRTDLRSIVRVGVLAPRVRDIDQVAEQSANTFAQAIMRTEGTVTASRCSQNPLHALKFGTEQFIADDDFVTRA